MTAGEQKRRQAPDFPFLEIGSFFRFPEPDDTGSTVVAVGGNLSPGMLVSAYTQGIFPWFNDDDPLLWHSPDPRFVILPETFHIPSRLVREIKRNPFEIRVDTAFERVITFCSAISRPDQEGTWITDDITEAYIRLHREGFAHSVEAWKGNELAGGFYGVHIGQAFFGESMFTRVDGAAKIIFAVFAGYFFSRMQGKFIDSQIYTGHIARFGGVNISRNAYLRKLNEALGFPSDRTGVSPGNILEKRGLWPSGMLQNV